MARDAASLFQRIAAAAIVAGALLHSSAARAGEADLFVVATPADHAAAAPRVALPKGAKRERLAALDPSALGAFAEIPVDAAAKPAASRRLRIALFPGAAGSFEVTGVERAYGGGAVITAEAAENGAATLVLADGALTGRVVLKGRVYRISPIAGRLHRIAELSRALLPPPGPHVVPPRRERRSAPKPAAAAGGKTAVTILVAYTRRAKAASRDILAEINLAIALSNRAYKASGADLRVRLVGSILISGYDENDVSYDQALDDLTGIGPGAEAFAAARSKRDRTGADLVALLREGGKFCGIGWLNAPPTAADADFGFSVSTRDCIEFDVVAHETGHNMGLNHDRFVEDRAPSSAFNFGFVNVRKRVLDIMAYDDKCRAAGVECEVVGKFSSPDLNVKGQPFGVPQGNAGAADAVRWLNENREAVASFRPDRAAPDAASAEAEDAREARQPAVAASR